MKLSKHSKIRMKERTNFNHQERVVLFKNALKHGGNWKTSKNEKLVKYLTSKETWKSQVKLYKGYVFIHSRNSKLLYTMYPLPDQYKENYEKEMKSCTKSKNQE